MSKEKVDENKKTQKKEGDSSQDSTKCAVIDIKGSQLKVYEGKKYEVDFLEGEKGEEVSVDTVLLYFNGEEIVVGKPYIDKAKVKFEIDSQKKGDKVNGFIYKSKTGYRKRFGHRALVTRLLVKEISI